MNEKTKEEAKIILNEVVDKNISISEAVVRYIIDKTPNIDSSTIPILRRVAKLALAVNTYKNQYY